MNYYIDTSALIKLYHREAGSQNVIDIYNSEENIIISELSVIEFISRKNVYKEEAKILFSRVD